MRNPTIAFVSGVVFAVACAAAPSAAASDRSYPSGDALAERLAAVPDQVDVAPRAIRVGGAQGYEGEGDPCCSPCTRFSLTLGLWIWGIDGTVGNNGREVDVDADWTDTLEILDKIEFAADVRARLTTGRWSFNLGIDGSTLADSADFVDGRITVDGELDLWVLQGHVGYNVAGGRIGCSPCAPIGCLEAYAGARAWWVEADVEASGTAAPGQRIDASESWVDPIVGLRGDLRFAGGWFGLLEVDVGGFGVGSDFSWHVLAAVGYRFSEHVALEVGWKHLDVDYEDGGFVFDAALSGPFLAMTFTF